MRWGRERRERWGTGEEEGYNVRRRRRRGRKGIAREEGRGEKMRLRGNRKRGREIRG